MNVQTDVTHLDTPVNLPAGYYQVSVEREKMERAAVERQLADKIKELAELQSRFDSLSTETSDRLVTQFSQIPKDVTENTHKLVNVNRKYQYFLLVELLLISVFAVPPADAAWSCFQLHFSVYLSVCLCVCMCLSVCLSMYVCYSAKRKRRGLQHSSRKKNDKRFISDQQEVTCNESDRWEWML